jgi:hypothetical protein
VQACYCGQRSCDRLTTSKQTAATGRSIQSAKLSAEAAGPSVFGGFAIKRGAQTLMGGGAVLAHSAKLPKRVEML